MRTASCRQNDSRPIINKNNQLEIVHNHMTIEPLLQLFEHKAKEF